MATRRPSRLLGEGRSPVAHRRDHLTRASSQGDPEALREPEGSARSPQGCVRLRATIATQIGSSLVSSGWQQGADSMSNRVDEPPIVRCPGCHHAMQPKERTSATERLVDIRYLCTTCGMETKRTVAEESLKATG
jgi:hypothetical protein